MLECNARRDLSHGTRVAASGYAYPSQLVDNEEYVRRCQFSPKSGWQELFDSSRIKTRRWCAPEETTRTLAEAAVDDLFARSEESPNDVDVIVVASGTTMTMAHPSDPENRAYADLSPLLAKRLRRTRALCLDIKACYCTGFVRGMQVVDGLLSNPNYRTALLVAVEQGSRFATAASNRTAFCGIAADAAGAFLFRRSSGSDGNGVIDYCGYTDVDKLSWVGIGDNADSIIMHGSRAAEATQEMLIECGRLLLQRNGLGPEHVDWFIPIQTHGGLLDSVADALQIPSQKTLWFGDEHGFSGSASIPSCFAEQRRAGVIGPGQLILSVAVGAGMNCGGALYRS